MQTVVRRVSRQYTRCCSLAVVRRDHYSSTLSCHLCVLEIGASPENAQHNACLPCVETLKCNSYSAACLLCVPSSRLSAASCLLPRSNLGTPGPHSAHLACRVGWVGALRDRKAGLAADAGWMRAQRQRHDRRRPWPLWVIVLLLLFMSAAVSTLGLLFAKHGYTAASSAASATVDNSNAAARNKESRNGLYVEQDAAASKMSSLRARANEEDAGGICLVVVVMPSPPMVSGPMTRMDRIRTIQDTWGRDLISKAGDSTTAGAAAGEVSTDNNRIVFVLDEADTATDEARRTWDALGANSAEGYTFPEADLSTLREREQEALQQTRKERPQTANQGARTRIVVVPTEVSNGGSDGDSRLRHVLERVAATYDPAFLFFCNEHTFVIAENLRRFVRDLDPSEPVYLGNRFRKEAGHGEPLLNSGAAGFVLSRGSLSLLRGAWGQIPSASHSEQQHEGRGEEKEGKLSGGGERGRGKGGALDEVLTECVATSKFEKGNPGVTLARCLNRLGVNAEDTTDSQGGQRFNAYGPVRLAQGNIDQWYKDVHASDPGMWRAGTACCSSDTISFHYVGPAEAKAMHHILHNREMYLADGYEKAFRAWPFSGKDLGGYSAAPRKGDPTFDLLLGKIRLFAA